MKPVLRSIVRGIAVLALSICAALPSYADGPPAFDLAGPKLTVTVTRLDQTLPIAEVPNLAAGDVLHVQADFPQGQAAHYLLIAAFLRGATNPPPEHWFYKSETWNRKDQNGLSLTVPDGAQQVILFLAPETGGDFKTLVNAVRGRPGAFVRASQDLNQATLDRSRLDTYLAAIRQTTAHDPAKLKEVAPILGRSLDIKVDDKCFDREAEMQAPCLMQNQDAIILNDGHSTSIVQALTSGPAADLAGQLSVTPQANFGYYSPYVQSVMDIARIMDSLHTAQYQYIPALATLNGDEMSLLLSTPPSFHNPKSVLVIALPAVEDPQPPPLHALEAHEPYCAKPQVALAAEGAPLVFSTDFAHGMALRVPLKDGKTADVPVKAEAGKGGFVITPKDGNLAVAGTTGTLVGRWGFQDFTGPAYKLVSDSNSHWTLGNAEHQSLVVGHEDVVQLDDGASVCVESVTLQGSDGKEIAKPAWKVVNPSELEVKLPLKNVKPGDVQLAIKSYGDEKPQLIELKTFEQPGHLDAFEFHAGDLEGKLHGARLEDATKLELNGVEFTPEKSTAPDSAELTMATTNNKAAASLQPDKKAKAQVYLRDGQVVPLDVVIGPPRPSVKLIGKNIERPQATQNIELGNPNELPEDAELTFSLSAQKPAELTHDVEVEVATEDESATVTLSAKNGMLTREDRNVVIARLDAAKELGGTAFGPLKFRVVEKDTPGDWQRLATLVRLPRFDALQCPAAKDQPCSLTGDNLFLLDSIATDPVFQHAVQVPEGFPGAALQVPHPENGQLFVKLRDDPTVVDRLSLTATPAPAAAVLPGPDAVPATPANTSSPMTEPAADLPPTAK